MQSLDKLRIRVFYDKDSIEWGDGWKDKIMEGVGQSEFAIIVISELFSDANGRKKNYMIY